MEQHEKLGFLGPCGTHSEEVARYLNVNRTVAWQLVPYPSIYEAILAVANGEIERCVVPVENSIEGLINITLDTLAHEVDLQVEHELVWFVHNQLLVKTPGEVITTILSHPQPLAQCRKYIKLNHAAAEIKEVSSTARAAEIVAAAALGYAAIGTCRAGELYNLTTVATEIQDNLTNCTRFWLLTKPQANLVQGASKTSLICQINGEKAGSLCDVLLEFSRRDVNLTHIESRPARTGLGEYIFFMSLKEASDQTKVKAAIDAVRQKSLWLKNLGSFDVTTIDMKKAEKRW